MKRIAIVGAGQSGLQLGLGLLAAGYEVTMFSNRTGEDIRHGKVMSSQCMFHTSLQIERDLGLDLWAHDCPTVDGIGLAVPHPEQKGAKAIDWAARLNSSAQSVDQRVKIPAWMDLFQKRGGELVFKDAGIDELEACTQSHDLTLVASGKGEISKLFERDAHKSSFDKPQRALALTYVKGMKPSEPFSAVCFNLIPGVGEYFVFPALTTTGPCEIMVFEGVPGGPMDCWSDVKTPQEHLARSKWILDTFAPWEAERCGNIELTDDNGILAGRFAPTVRKPVATLPSGRKVLGLADVVVLNDPITGQGSNNAAKCADTYLKSILARGDGAADAAWMQQTFDRYWFGYAQWVTQWTNMLLAPPPPHVLKLLGSAGAIPPLASAFANGFDDPRTFFPWFADPAEAERYIETCAAAA
ncbi:styrene monooxygenase/indole monooxygenase family protein [Variovorax paradoxus]|uniref:Styrene monooxygenase StyA n=1 Tax=Variovorax paradoxus TaxID=34073 RepID=A0A0H2LV47_VARPD|nr:styrene monooxygenase/indole monooxygenase family protein [Variovorax paradoxus]KLN53566.1 styrene monooxygenase StyA [Variovorax paradoxus]